mmetsp:Transcript_18473/g.22077  ORF Transcript_18473/g.22077 Transcript_18473/m.22077 type:complete len:427 (-) Transcript_18473:284-1564(-)|eukprot:CAMPEP_0198265644 /NCGR_PEP_ID=MMETSP1447-20131203/23832_1 /TAXON_ID=420782 /ORGANISM="Chaetoceros dichaeta, Strain CCMP1751" /LENGTH=426 /DNA_ID=CAMNT_0043955243 /DNA_START=17 /DNA_END=1297 /DNA_ORIENTATION=+
MSANNMSISSTGTATNNLQSLIYRSNHDDPSSSELGSVSSPYKLDVLDQLLLPHTKKYIPIPNVEAAWSVIRSMQTRGAPLIAIVASLGLAVDLKSNSKSVEELVALEKDATDSSKIVAYIKGKIDYLRTSRPTAVNLFNAMDEIVSVMDKEAIALKVEMEAGSTSPSDMRERIIGTVTSHAEFMLKRDVDDNKAIGSHGAKALIAKKIATTKNDATSTPNGDDAKKTGIRMITICNTGSLATASYGTALGVARALHSSGNLTSIHALETRPYNQGSRLTAFEISEEKMPGGTLIVDSAVAALMRTKGADACVVGADRVCANGDTANKIGTYMLACVAKAHDVPFYVACPFTTLDLNLEHGDLIEIEERSSKEMIESVGAPKEMNCWNPAFDVTPADFITGIITENGVIHKGADGKFDIKGFANAI